MLFASMILEEEQIFFFYISDYYNFIHCSLVFNMEKILKVLKMMILKKKIEKVGLVGRIFCPK